MDTAVLNEKLRQIFSLGESEGTTIPQQVHDHDDEIKNLNTNLNSEKQARRLESILSSEIRSIENLFLKLDEEEPVIIFTLVNQRIFWIQQHQLQ